jgi:hypothetical protein
LKLYTLDDGSPQLDFRDYEWADFDALVLRLRAEFGFSCRTDPRNREHCWLTRDGMQLEAGPVGTGYRVQPLDQGACDLLRVVVGVVLKEAEDRTRHALRQAASSFA